MSEAILEHVNFTVADAERTANRLCDLFDWKIRWKGASIHGGFTVHVGNDDSYLAIYSPGNIEGDAERSYWRSGGLNHIGVVVDNIEVTEDQVKAMGYEPHNHANYEPGRRFYFDNEDGIEFEVVSYA